MAETGKNIAYAAGMLSDGKLVAIPTETVYGLAANAFNEKAVLSVFEAKNRPFFDPLIVHTHSLEAASAFADFSDQRLFTLAKTFWPGPLTLLLPKSDKIPDLVCSGLSRVGIRIPDHPLTLALLQSLPFPLAAPSANPFGYVSPTQPAHVEKQLGDKVSYILDGGPSSVGLESTIVGTENGHLYIYRLGGLSIESIESVVGPVKLQLNQSSNPLAPGQLKSHYSPRKPLYLGNLEELQHAFLTQRLAIISFGHPGLPSNQLHFDLSPGKNLQEAALNLFKMLRLADESDADIVICEEVPDTGLGRAINDRLRRAASK